jgi:hypothetical protein
MIRHGLRTKTILAALLLLASCGDAVAIQFSDAHYLTFDQNATNNLSLQTAGAADINNDGRTDVVFVVGSTGLPPYASTDFMVYAYEQQPNGSMALATKFSYAPGGIPQEQYSGAALGDLNHDGKAELVMVGANNDLVIFSRAGDGTFSQAARVPCPFRSIETVIRDLDGDGNMDIIVQSGGVGFAVYKGNGSFTFAAPVYHLGYAQVSGPSNGNGGGFNLADLNQDGRLDMLTVQQLGIGVLGVNYGLGNDLFGEPHRIPSSPSNPIAATAGEFTGDGKTDIAGLYEERVDLGNNIEAIYQTIDIFERGVDGTFAKTHGFHYEDLGAVQWTTAMMRWDIDHDGDDDIIVFRADHVEVLLQDHGAFTLYVVPNSHDTFSQDPAITSAHIADFNGDGCDDIGYADERGYVINYRVDCPAH